MEGLSTYHIRLILGKASSWGSGDLLLPLTILSPPSYIFLNPGELRDPGFEDSRDKD
jgi:hypothetical protein